MRIRIVHLRPTTGARHPDLVLARPPTGRIAAISVLATSASHSVNVLLREVVVSACRGKVSDCPATRINVSQKWGGHVGVLSPLDSSLAALRDDVRALNSRLRSVRSRWRPTRIGQVFAALVLLQRRDCIGKMHRRNDSCAQQWLRLYRRERLNPLLRPERAEGST